jgi:hypothetical protein
MVAFKTCFFFFNQTGNITTSVGQAIEIKPTSNHISNLLPAIETKNTE